MSGGKADISSRLASMRFMKRAAAATQQQLQAPTDTGPSFTCSGRWNAHAAASAIEVQVGKLPQQNSQPPRQPEGNQQKKYALSEKLASMKFMQRAKQVKRGFEEAIGEPDAAKQQAEWVAADRGTAGNGCIIIQERDPLPAGILGRVSFNKFNSETEALQQVAETKMTGPAFPSAAAADDSSNEQEGVSIKDDDMAGWGRSKNVLSSLRMQACSKKHKRQKVH